MRVIIMRSTAHRILAEGSLSRARGRSRGDGKRRREGRGAAAREGARKAGRGKRKSGRRRMRSQAGSWGGGGVARGYTPYDGVGMRESALGRRG